VDKATLNANQTTNVCPSPSVAMDMLIARMDKTRLDVGQNVEMDWKDKSFSVLDKVVVCPCGCDVMELWIALQVRIYKFHAAKYHKWQTPQKVRKH